MPAVSTVPKHSVNGRFELQTEIGVIGMRTGWFLCGMVCFLIGCGGGSDTAGDVNDPANTSDAAAMTETDANAGQTPDQDMPVVE